MSCENNACAVSPPRKNVERIRDPTPPPVVKRIVVRAPTPEPDIIERVIIKKRPQQIIERVHETPKKPPPRVVEKIVYEPVPMPAPQPCAYGAPQIVPPPSVCGCAPSPLPSGPIPTTITMTSPPYYPTTSTTSSTYPGPMGF